jgi:hypothetical protein
MCYRKLLLLDLILSSKSAPFTNINTHKKAISDNKAFQFMILSFIKILNNISTAIKFYLHFYETNKNNLKDIRRIDPTEYLFKLTIIAVIKLCVGPDFSRSVKEMGNANIKGMRFMTFLVPFYHLAHEIRALRLCLRLMDLKR